jgi:hypothetical protein
MAEPLTRSLPHSGSVALSGFLILSAPCSPPRRPTLFRAGNAHGVHPSELSPLEEPCHLSAAVAFLTFTSPFPRRRTRTGHAKRAKPAARLEHVRDASARTSSRLIACWVDAGHPTLRAGEPAFGAGGLMASVARVRDARGASGRSQSPRGDPSAGRLVPRRPRGARARSRSFEPATSGATLAPRGRQELRGSRGRCRSTSRRIRRALPVWRPRQPSCRRRGGRSPRGGRRSSCRTWRRRAGAIDGGRFTEVRRPPPTRPAHRSDDPVRAATPRHLRTEARKRRWGQPHEPSGDATPRCRARSRTRGCTRGPQCGPGASLRTSATTTRVVRPARGRSVAASDAASPSGDPRAPPARSTTPKGGIDERPGPRTSPKTTLEMNLASRGPEGPCSACHHHRRTIGSWSDRRRRARVAPKRGRAAAGVLPPVRDHRPARSASAGAEALAHAGRSGSSPRWSAGAAPSASGRSRCRRRAWRASAGARDGLEVQPPHPSRARDGPPAEAGDALTERAMSAPRRRTEVRRRRRETKRHVRGEARLQGFALLESSLPPGSGLDHLKPGALLGFQPLQGFPLHCLGSVLPPALLSQARHGTGAPEGASVPHETLRRGARGCLTEYQ